MCWVFVKAASGCLAQHYQAHDRSGILRQSESQASRRVESGGMEALVWFWDAREQGNSKVWRADCDRQFQGQWRRPLLPHVADPRLPPGPNETGAIYPGCFLRVQLLLWMVPAILLLCAGTVDRPTVYCASFFCQAAQTFIQNVLGERYVAPVTMNFEELISVSDSAVSFPF